MDRKTLPVAVLVVGALVGAAVVWSLSPRARRQLRLSLESYAERLGAELLQTLLTALEEAEAHLKGHGQVRTSSSGM